ncbi:unnamed protein product [Caenorhabditis nigoni]
MILFPEFAGYPLGFVRLFDVKYYVFPVVISLHFLGCMLVAIIAIFENQFHTICTFSKPVIWSKYRRTWLICVEN